MRKNKLRRSIVVLGLITFAAGLRPDLTRAAEFPKAIAAPDLKPVAQFHAIGDQIYECKPDKDGTLSWAFREPLATLLNSTGKTVGRHFAGPRWMLDDGSFVKGAVIASIPGTTPSDVAWLKLKVVEHGGNGLLSKVTIVQRINVEGGNLTGSCAMKGNLKLVPYNADYVFLSP